MIYNVQIFFNMIRRYVSCIQYLSKTYFLHVHNYKKKNSM